MALKNRQKDNRKAGLPNAAALRTERKREVAQHGQEKLEPEERRNPNA